tara:strand:- start:928 stop:2118 length:1191 start_codon:yes stop_codon:yes gene_type:complete
MSDKFGYVYEDPSTANQITGSTPYGTYDSDTQFVTDSLPVIKWIARRLGHPVMQLEFSSGSLYACYEEAVSEYSSLINEFNMKNWLWESIGSDSKESGSAFSSTGSIQPAKPHMGMTSYISKQYGEAVNVGGDTTMYSGSITLTGSKQVYDLPTEASFESSINTTSDNIEVQRVFNYGKAALTKFYDPFAGGFDQMEMLEDFGFGNVSPAVSFILRPISHDISRAQTIETSDKIRKSNYSFELVNNKLRIFPAVDTDDTGNKILFHYYKRNDLSSNPSYTENKVTDPSNIPYKFLTYAEINSNGRQWIRKYALALSRELLGIIRSKYANLPLPNGEVSLDGEGLKAEGREEKSALVEELREFLESVSLTEQSRKSQEQADANQSVLNKAPLKIYIG